MKIAIEGDHLKVTNVEALDNAHAPAFQAAIQAALPAKLTHIAIDLSQTSFMDCGGLGALVALRNYARQRNAKTTVRLLNAPAFARRILGLTGSNGFLGAAGAERGPNPPECLSFKA